MKLTVAILGAVMLGTGLAHAQSDKNQRVAAEQKLSEAWKTAYGKVTQTGKPAVLAEQRLWIAFKDRSCLSYYSKNGEEDEWGSMRTSVFDECRTHIIEDRVRELQSVRDNYNNH